MILNGTRGIYMAYNETPTEKDIAMFKNREFRVRIAKINDNTPEATQEHSTIDPEQIAEVTKDVMFLGHGLTKDLVKYTAKAVAGVVVLTVVASTIGDVIVNKSNN